MVSRSTVRSVWSLYAISLIALCSVAFAEEQAPGYAGSAACIDCHKEQSLSGAHAAKTDPKAPAAKFGCETCHGPAAEHVRFQNDESGKDPNIPNLRIGLSSGKTPTELNQVCLSCHNTGHVVMWEGSIHERRDVACVDCHNPHAKNKALLTKPTQTEVCSSCHKDVRAQLQLNSHHPIREGKMQCSDCHNSHGSVADKLIDANYVNEKCYECHAEKRGPFLWDHAPVQENCLTCHSPHGSMHNPLLKQREPFLCQSCHSNARHPSTMYSIPEGTPNRNVYQTLNNRVFYRSCQNCHSRIHGSNSPSGKSLAR